MPDGPVPSLVHRRRVTGQCIIYVGLDVHKDTIAVAAAEVDTLGRLAARTRERLEALLQAAGNESDNPVSDRSAHLHNQDEFANLDLVRQIELPTSLFEACFPMSSIGIGGIEAPVAMPA